MMKRGNARRRSWYFGGRNGSAERPGRSASSQHSKTLRSSGPALRLISVDVGTVKGAGFGALERSRARRRDCFRSAGELRRA